jgi:hypothetical protein
VGAFLAGTAVLVPLYSLQKKAELAAKTLSQPGSEYAQFLALKNKLESTGKFKNVSVMANTFHMKAFNTKTERQSHSLVVTATRKEGNVAQSVSELKPEFDEIFQLVRSEMQDLSSFGEIQVGLHSGYNIGIRAKSKIMFQIEVPSKPGERKDGPWKENF